MDALGWLFAAKREYSHSNDMKNQSKTDWTRVDALQDPEIDFSDVPELDDEFFAHAVRWPEGFTSGPRAETQN